MVYAHSNLKILSACDEQPKGFKGNIHTTTPLVFGKQQRTFVIMPCSTTIQQTLLKVRSVGEALLKVKPHKYVKARSVAMNSMLKRFMSSPGIPNFRCYCYKWVSLGLWDSELPQQGIPLGIITGLARAMASHFISIVRTKPLWPPLAS